VADSLLVSTESEWKFKVSETFHYTNLRECITNLRTKFGMVTGYEVRIAIFRNTLLLKLTWPETLIKSTRLLLSTTLLSILGKRVLILESAALTY
jgi:hypothetical protein